LENRYPTGPRLSPRHRPQPVRSSLLPGQPQQALPGYHSRYTPQKSSNLRQVALAYPLLAPPLLPPPPPRNPSPPPPSIVGGGKRLDGILSCRGCPWRQVDVDKARICESCKAIKLEIVAHRHFDFVELLELDDAISGFSPSTIGRGGRSCMICVQQVVWKCTGCPLKVCPGCKAQLVDGCKGKVEWLLKYFYRSHVRNDAFLLRSDGGGFETVGQNQARGGV